jgi:hypothetical protein
MPTSLRSCLVLSLLALAAVVPSAAAAQAPTRPTRAQAFTIAGEVAGAWADALDAADVEIESCGPRGSSLRRCVIHVFDDFDCHWRVNSQLLPTGELSWWTTRVRSLDTECTADDADGAIPSSGKTTIPATGLLV